jgi:hypothetical protein
MSERLLTRMLLLLETLNTALNKGLCFGHTGPDAEGGRNTRQLFANAAATTAAGMEEVRGRSPLHQHSRWARDGCDDGEWIC